MPYSVPAPDISLAVRDALGALFSTGWTDPFNYPARNLLTCDAKWFASPVVSDIMSLIGGSIAAGNYTRPFTVPTGMAVGTLCYLSGATTLAAADSTTAAKAAVIGILRYKPTPTSTAGFIDHLWYQTGISAGTVGNPVFLKNDGSLGPAAGTIAKRVGVYITTTTALCWASPQTSFELIPDGTTLDTSGTGGTLETIRASAANARAATDPNKALTPSNLNDYAAPQTLADGATIAWNIALGVNAAVTLAGNRTLGAPTNLRAGASGHLAITQDATGTRTLAYNAVWKFPAGTPPTLSTPAASVDLLTWYSPDGTNLYASLAKAFA